MRPVGSKYLLEEPLGRGATGTVWRGYQRETAGEDAAVAGQPGERVAIKLLREELAHDPDVVMRFLRERSVLLRLGQASHANIVRTRDLVVEGDQLALVMDLIDGPDLHRYLRENGPLSPVAAALMTAQIADALAAAHAKGIVHRDLKPANVLLAGGDEATGGPASTPGAPANPPVLRPMLTDFGIARLADSPGVTRAHEFVGTPSYVAPESAEGREQTSAVDIYGAGILLYELAAGHPPFTGSSTLELLQRHLSEQPQRPAGMPDPLWTVIDRCLRKSPDERPSAANLARALRTVAAGIGEGATGDQWAAAAGVAMLLGPDSAPVKVPGTGISPPGSTEPTQAMPGGSGSGTPDPNAQTDVLPHTDGPGSPDAAPTRAMPTQADGPHPWGDQMRAARDRNEPTQVQPIDPARDPLHRPPRRQPQRAPQRRPQRPAPDGRQGYGYPPQQPAPYQQQPQYGQRYQQPDPYQQRPPAREPRREPRGRSRSSAPMRIPGLGCLKGCLFTILILVLIGVLVWNFTPVQDWIADGKSFWNATKDWFDDVREFLGLVEEAKQTGDEINQETENLPDLPNLPDGG